MCSFYFIEIWTWFWWNLRTNDNESILVCDYPTSSFIKLIYYESNGKRHERSYNILSLGNYPSNVKYTQRGKKNSAVYKIPNKYKVETVLGDFWLFVNLITYLMKKLNIQLNGKTIIMYLKLFQILDHLQV